jgi:hypothetical protein
MLKRPLEPHCNHSAQMMCVATTYLLRDSYHHSSKLFQFCSFIVSSYFIYSIEYIVHWIYVCSSYLYVYCIQSVNQFVPLLNMDQWYQSGMLFI